MARNGSPRASDNGRRPFGALHARFGPYRRLRLHGTARSKSGADVAAGTKPSLCAGCGGCENDGDGDVEPGHLDRFESFACRLGDGWRTMIRLSCMSRHRRRPRVVSQRWLLCWAGVFALAGICLVGVPPASAALLCHRGGATGSVVGRPTSTVAWRAELLGGTGVYGGVSRVGTRPGSSVGPAQASWLLVLDAARTHSGRCWVQVRLPWRPNDASGWVDATQVILRPTIWRIVVSTAGRSLSVYRRGTLVRRVQVVVGAPGTPTPVGLFSIIGAWASPPDAFLGSWILPLTNCSQRRAAAIRRGRRYGRHSWARRREFARSARVGPQSWLRPCR